MRVYVVWALIGMIGYSFTTLFVKLAVRTGHISSFAVLAVATAIVALSSVAIAVMRGDLAALPDQADMTAKHTTAMLAARGADKKSQEMVQAFAGGMFKQFQSEQPDAKRDTGSSGSTTPLWAVGCKSGSDRPLPAYQAAGGPRRRSEARLHGPLRGPQDLPGLPGFCLRY